ncbi:MAG: hypothetical protein ACXW15_13525, partial [Acidimicrobiia bacterium]
VVGGCRASIRKRRRVALSLVTACERSTLITAARGAVATIWPSSDHLDRKGNLRAMTVKNHQILMATF